MQGSVWGSLKCTTSMDQLNKIILPQKELTYNYKEDENIEIGVLGMVDDNLSISKCGINSLRKKLCNKFVYRNAKIDIIGGKKCGFAHC
jgi:hypothetical protein